MAEALRAPSIEPDEDDHQLVGDAQHAVHRRVHQPGAAVGEDDVVEVLEQVHRAAVVLLAVRLRHRGVLLAGEHLQPRRALRGVGPHVGVAAHALGVAQEVAHRGAGLQGDLLAERAAVGVGVDGHDPVAAEGGERGPRPTVVVVLPTPPFRLSTATR